MTQLLLNTMNEEVVTKIARLSYEMQRHARVETGDNSMPPWDKADKKAAQDSVRNLINTNFPVADTEDEVEKFLAWVHRSTVRSILALWSGSSNMGPQITPLPYEPAINWDPQPTPKPDTPAEPQEDVTIIDDSDDEVDPTPGTEEPASTEEKSEESSKPKRAKKR